MSRPFPSKYENTCPRCKGKIEIGMMVEFDRDNKLVHQDCPRSASSPASSGPSGPPSDHFVQVAAWVPFEKVQGVLAAIKEARGW